MKAILKTVICLLIFISIISCNEQSEPKQAFSEFKIYVIAHRDSIENYFDKDLKEMQAEYDSKKSLAEKSKGDWSDLMKAEFMELQIDWESFREDYQSEKARRDDLLEAVADRVNTVLPEGIEEGLSNVNANNILAVYIHIVEYIENNRKDLSIEQWNQIAKLWERLGVRLNHVKKELNGSVKAAIEEQKIRYDIIRSMNMPVATMETETE